MNHRSSFPLATELITDRVIYFPIRHHSPACARHLEWLLRDWRPQAVLIEGPAAFTPLIPLVLHPRTRAPFAFYTSFVDGRLETDASGVEAKARSVFGPARYAAYYPFCDYSPELLALRVGQEIGASLQFIDLDYREQILAEQKVLQETGAPRVESLLAERHFKRSTYLQALARRAGCRDHNDLWDHLFETRVRSLTELTRAVVDDFLTEVAAWCHYARVEVTEAELGVDGTLAREAAMAEAVKAELARGTARIVVVTGGFHTVALPQLVAAGGGRPAEQGRRKEDPQLNCLIRYSFEQLDALNGYSAGMPSPHYYDQLWQATVQARAPEAMANLAARILVELGQLTRRKKLAVALSPADEIAALEQARRLAGLRGHPGPTREDLLDGIRSCFVKGSLDAEGEVLLALARQALGGTGIGEVPPEAGVPPLVEDFKLTAGKLRLHLNDSIRRKSSLDLYRKISHRRCSRFFHGLTFLGVPFATLMAGPDFVKGVALERLFEHWDYQWTPQTEGRLVEASVYGATLEEACANRLFQAMAELENVGRGRCASAAVGMLIHACRMGLHRQTDRLLVLIADQVKDDPALASLTGALSELILLWESREPLEAHQLIGIPKLIGASYERACYLAGDLATTPAEAARPTLEALIVLRDLLRSGARGESSLDADLLYRPLAKLLSEPNCPALLVGGAAGLLFGEGRLGEAELLRLMTGSLNASTAGSESQIGFLIGLLRACRELAWRLPALAEAVDKLLASWSEEEFLEKIPNLRLAFSDLTPREVDQVAEVVGGLHQGTKIGSLHHPDLGAEEMLAAARVNALVTKALLEDGLADWGDRVPVRAVTGGQP